MSELKTYKCIIDESLDSDLQVEFVALVDRPAIERNFLAFDEKLKFAVDEDKRIISGPAMLADFPIYRNDEAYGEYFVTFEKETILSIVQKFFKQGFIKNFNLFHDPNQETTGLTIFESFIVDSERGISPMKGFEDAKDGSWFLSAKVEDEAVWEKIKAGEVKGFSVEGVFQYATFKAQPKKLTDEEVLAKIKELLSETGLAI